MRQKLFPPGYEIPAWAFEQYTHWRQRPVEQIEQLCCLPTIRADVRLAMVLEVARRWEQTKALPPERRR